MTYHFFLRKTGGVTVSKKPKLPEGDFYTTEYTWHGSGIFCVLWFVKDDKFTAAEREAAKDAYMAHRHCAAWESKQE